MKQQRKISHQNSIPKLNKQRRLRVLMLTLICCCVAGATALVFAAERAITITSTKTTGMAKPSARLVTSQTTAAADQHGRVHRARLSPRLRWSLAALGDRLEKPGKERLTMLGKIKLSGESQDTPVRITYEHPGRLRFENLGGDRQARTIDFDRRSGHGDGKQDRVEQAIIETLVFDTVDGFFEQQMSGAATRFLGTRFRLDDGSAADYAGPYYDIYQVSEPVEDNSATQYRRKFYYFNSDTLLMERVRYWVDRAGVQTNIEVQMSDWRKVQDQQLPGRIVRLENGDPVLTISINSVGIGARVTDAVFGQSQE